MYELWLHIFLTKCLSQGTLFFTSIFANSGNSPRFLNYRVDGVWREKKKKNSGKTPRVILYSYMWYYLRFDRAYARWKEFDGNRKWASDHVVSSLRANERNGSERLCPLSVTSFCVSLCSGLWKLLARASSTSHSAFRKSSFFFPGSHLSDDTTWIASFEKALPPALLRNF